MGDLDSEGKPIHKMMGSCLPSIDNSKKLRILQRTKIDIVIIDEIEQAIMMQTDSGGIVNPKDTDYDKCANKRICNRHGRKNF